MFHIVFGETMQKLSQPPISQQAMSLINFRPSAAFLLENGFETLRKILHNDNKLSFWEVFGLSHLAYASTLLSNPADLKQEFRQTFSDIIRLSNQIIYADDKAAFTQLAHELWLPEPYLAGAIVSSDEAVLHMNVEVMQSSAGNVSFASMIPLTLAQPTTTPSTYRNQVSAHISEGGLFDLSESIGSTTGMTTCRAVRRCFQTLECTL